MRKATLAASVAAIFVLGVAHPAAAVERTYSVQSTTTDASGNRLNQGANARVLNGDAATVNVQLECFANTSPPAIGIGIQECYVQGADGARYDAADLEGNPGPVSVRTGVHLGIERQHYRVCVKSNAFFSGAGTFLQAPLVCSA